MLMGGQPLDAWDEPNIFEKKNQIIYKKDEDPEPVPKKIPKL